MNVLLDNATKISLGIDYEGIAKNVIDASLEYVHCPYECEVNILLTDNEGIRELNRQMRDIDSATDVLSFPAIDFIKPGDFSVVDNSPALYFNADSNDLILGDIMISLDRVRDQAMEYGHGVTREYAFLIAHSMLHLAGYDHINDDERIDMERMQDDILESIGYTRDLTD